MKKITYQQLKSIFCEHEGKKTGTHLTGYIVFTEDSFNQVYSLESRTYVVHSSSKAFVPGMGGYSIYGSALDGSDNDVRLEVYMALERGGEKGWQVDYCYLEDDSLVPDPDPTPAMDPKPKAKKKRSDGQKWRVGFKVDGKWEYRQYSNESQMIREVAIRTGVCEKVSITKIRERFKL